MYIYCYYGHVAAQSFAGYADCVYESKWYKMPIQHQKHIRFMIQNAHRPIFYDGLGMMFLNLETYTKVK